MPRTDEPPSPNAFSGALAPINAHHEPPRHGGMMYPYSPPRGFPPHGPPPGPPSPMGWRWPDPREMEFEEVIQEVEGHRAHQRALERTLEENVRRGEMTVEEAQELDYKLEMEHQRNLERLRHLPSTGPPPPIPPGVMGYGPDVPPPMVYIPPPAANPNYKSPGKPPPVSPATSESSDSSECYSETEVYTHRTTSSKRRR
eukprot:TRINITY_DN93458_c0_g1_i1.p1 TRINITY_DN93458_c0_g1~~TRINITY_DN93458_c0_g1_i1.p1  ORF type:complete len:200 (+),score=9.18 TRINITY_DN93458_c0_g1_i1:139-738(+)